MSYTITMTVVGATKTPIDFGGGWTMESANRLASNILSVIMAEDMAARRGNVFTMNALASSSAVVVANFSIMFKRPNAFPGRDSGLYAFIQLKHEPENETDLPEESGLAG